MSISLEKRAEKIGIILAKHNIVQVPPIRVGLALDISGSTQDMYYNGTMQETVDRLLAVSLKFDDNGELDMWSFDTRSHQLKTATPNDYGTYIKRNILENHNISKWGGTRYGEVLNDMVKYWFDPKPITEKVKGFFGLFSSEKTTGEQPSSALPAMGLLVTDGETSDEDFAEQVLSSSQNKNVYWQMIGVGPAHHFQFLQEVADDLPNVGFVNLASLTISDDDLYNELIGQECIEWIKNLKA